MTSKPLDEQQLREVAEANVYIRMNMWVDPQEILSALDELAVLRKENEGLMAANGIMHKSLDRLAQAPGCGCHPVCRCGEGDWSRYEIEGRMDEAQKAIDDARHATKGE